MTIWRLLLLPVSILYGWITWLRNKFFDWGVLPSRKFDHPVIGVGNLIVGGSGKTPMIEFIIRLLKPRYKIAVLSRGYLRKTRGYKVATSESTVKQVGDEPLQLALKHPDVHVAVCEKRKKGIKTILKEKPDNQVVLLDDSFQHRYVKPGLNIILSDYHKIFTRNFMLPTGNLREYRSGVKRADCLIITKTPSVFSPLDKKLILKDLKKFKIKKILFSYIKYGEWIPITEAARKNPMQEAKTIFLLTGIANPTPLAEHLKRSCLDLHIFRYSDHHQFTRNDIEKIMIKYRETFSGTKAIVTTEKDSMRLRNPELASILKPIPVYYVPIEVDFHEGDKVEINKIINNYVESYFPVAKKKRSRKPSGNRKVKK